MAPLSLALILIAHASQACDSLDVSLSQEGELVSEPRAVATGSYAQLGQNLYFVSSGLIRSLPLAVLTRFTAV